MLTPHSVAAAVFWSHGLEGSSRLRGKLRGPHGPGRCAVTRPCHHGPQRPVPADARSPTARHGGNPNTIILSRNGIQEVFTISEVVEMTFGIEASLSA